MLAGPAVTRSCAAPPAPARPVVTGANSGPRSVDRWERGGERPRPVSSSASATIPASRFGYATRLSCRECGQTCELGAQHACAECFGPLEGGYDYPSLTRESIESGPPSIWRYASLLPVPADVASRPNTEPGFTRLGRADRLAGRAGMRGLWGQE